jgi:hypothetical protein
MAAEDSGKLFTPRNPESAKFDPNPEWRAAGRLLFLTKSFAEMVHQKSDAPCKVTSWLFGERNNFPL